MTRSVHELRQQFHSRRMQALHHLWQLNLSALPWWRRFLMRSLQILVAVVRDLLQGQLSLRAMSLVFTTLIGFFPLLALTFAVLKSLGVHNAMEPTLLTLLDPLGERANQLTTDILSYVDNLQVEIIGITSVGLLLYIVLDMMRKIESSFNYIWSVKQGRSWSNRISEYLFAVIVSPLLLFMSISITSWANTNFFQSFLENLIYGGVIIAALAFITPVLLMSLAFAFAYVFLPNTKVHFGSAFIGGFITTIIWKLMGSVFQVLFVSPARESIYLAFATAVAVLFFTYFGWLVALVGSSIAYYHQNPAKARGGRDLNLLSIARQEELGLVLATLIIRRFQAGKHPATESELARALSGSPIAIEDSLVELQQIGLITRTADDPVRYVPRIAVQDLTLVEIWQKLRHNSSSGLANDLASKELQFIRQFETDVETAVAKQLGSTKFIEDSV